MLAELEADDDPRRRTWLSQAKIDKGCPPAPAPLEHYAHEYDDDGDGGAYDDDERALAARGAVECEAELGGALNEYVTVCNGL